MFEVICLYMHRLAVWVTIEVYISEKNYRCPKYSPDNFVVAV